jgi:hypothetical protein
VHSSTSLVLLCLYCCRNNGVYFSVKEAQGRLYDQTLSNITLLLCLRCCCSMLQAQPNAEQQDHALKNFTLLLCLRCCSVSHYLLHIAGTTASTSQSERHRAMHSTTSLGLLCLHCCCAGTSASTSQSRRHRAMHLKYSLRLLCLHCCRHNGVYFSVKEAQGHLYDQTLSNITLKYLKERAKDQQPFFAYLATRSIHS